MRSFTSLSDDAVVSPTLRELQLPGQTVVVIGDSSGIGIETANYARLLDIDFEQARCNIDQHLWSRITLKDSPPVWQNIS
ncbi:MAG: hypothetical protein WBV94_06080 [Blastocatellia bacterium]